MTQPPTQSPSQPPPQPPSQPPTQPVTQPPPQPPTSGPPGAPAKVVYLALVPCLFALCLLAPYPAFLRAPAIAVAETRPAYGGTISAGLLSEPVAVDPASAGVGSHADVTVASLIFDTLYRIQGQEPSGALRIVPLVAAAMPEVSGDGLQVRVRVRPGIAFHDASALDARDVAASLQRVMNSPSAYLLASVRSIDRQGDDIVLSLSRPTPELPALLAAPATGITPAGRAPRWSRAIGSGPFKLAGVDRKQRQLTLTANNLYFAGRPYINKLVLRWFERGYDETEAYEIGQSHISLRGAVAYAGHTPKYRTAEATGPATLLLYVGMGRTKAHRAITDDRDFRRALSLAMERDSFRAVGTGERITATLHPVANAIGGPSPTSAERRARVREARQALARAARSVSELQTGTGARDTLELDVIIDRTRPDDREIAEKVLAALFHLGIKARISSLDAADFAERVAGGACDLYIGQATMPVPVPEWILADVFARAGDNWIRTRQAASPLDHAAADRAFAERLPIIPLFHRAVRVHHRDNVRGLHFDDSSRLSFADLYFFGRAQPSK